MRDDRNRPDILSRLLLMGTVHGDPQGLKRLQSFFGSFKPDLILVELSPFARAFRKRHQTYFQNVLCRNLEHAARKSGVPFRDALKHPRIVSIRRQVCLPFEYRAASSYARNSGAGLFTVDYSLFSRQWIDSWPELISVQNLSVLLSLPSSRTDVAQVYRLASYHIRGTKDSSLHGIFKKTDPSSELWEVRERYMAEEVGKLLFLFRPARPVYIGGWRHLVSGGAVPALRDLLKVESFRCRLLSEATEQDG